MSAWVSVALGASFVNPILAANTPRYPLIFDPQTAGGLLASIPATQAQACLAALKATGYPKATAIGRVLPQSDALEAITLIG